MNRRRINTIIITFIVAIFVLVAVFPFYIMLVMGTHVNETLYRGLVILPGNNLINNMRTVLGSNFIRFYINSLFISVIATSISIAVSTMAGYSLSIYHFRLWKLFFFFVLTTMMIPPHIGIVAYIVQMRFLGLTNSLWPMIFWWTAHGFGVFLMTQFMRSGIPLSIIESARIDGAHEFYIYLKLALPLAKSAIVTLIMIVFVLSWNNYLLPLVLINKVELYTVPLGVATLGSAYRTDYTAMIAGLALGTLPVLFVFIGGSKHFIQGITAGALKG